MSQGLCLLDEALDLARQEMLALEDGAYDRAVVLAVIRASLQRSRREKQRMRGYHQAVGQALQ